jgi:hypothetical protein
MTTDQPEAVAQVTRRLVVLELLLEPARSPFYPPTAMYGRRPEDGSPPRFSEPGLLPVIHLSPEDYRALGEADRVTITIEPLSHRAPCVDGSVCGGPHCPPADVPATPEPTRLTAARGGAE